MHIGALDAEMLPKLLALYRSRGFQFIALPQAERDPFYRVDTDPGLPSTPDSLEDLLKARHLPVPAPPPPPLNFRLPLPLTPRSFAEPFAAADPDRRYRGPIIVPLLVPVLSPENPITQSHPQAAPPAQNGVRGHQNHRRQRRPHPATKSLRVKMRLEAGDDLLIEAEGDRITMRPLRREALLKKEYGIDLRESLLILPSPA